MTQDTVHSRLQAHFPALCRTLPYLPTSAYQLINAPANTTIFDIGGACEQFLLLTAGKIGVKMLAKNGKSILLYRVNPGQSCIITTSCLLGNARYPTFGETETDIEALSIPGQAFTQALDESNEFRKFVFNGLGQRLADVMQRLESVNFTSIDSRLAIALLSRRRNAKRIEVTHESLAEEVGTAREVVSRHLKKMEAKGLLQLERGTVVIKNVVELDALCE
jgi:CRP/FNR family transcriptional regulator